MRNVQNEKSLTLLGSMFVGGLIGKYLLHGPCSLWIGVGAALALCLIWLMVDNKE